MGQVCLCAIYRTEEKEVEDLPDGDHTVLTVGSGAEVIGTGEQRHLFVPILSISRD